MENYWVTRLAETKKKADTTSNPELLKVYLALEEHYQSMLKFSKVERDSYPVKIPQYESDISASVTSPYLW